MLEWLNECHTGWTALIAFSMGAFLMWLVIRYDEAGKKINQAAKIIEKER